MKILKLVIPVILALCLSGCGAIFMHSMGARGRAVPLNKVNTIYYKTSPDLKKAYLFYSLPGRIVTGMSEGSGSMGDARSITVDFGAVRDTERNRKEFGEGIHSHYKIGEEWVAEFDIGDNDPSRPHDEEIKIFYGIERRDRDEPIPYRGIWIPTQ